MEDYTRIALTVAAIAQTLYVLEWLTVRWWRSSIGRAHFFKSTALALVLDVLVVGWWWSEPPYVWAVLSTVLAIGITTQLGVFVRERFFPGGDGAARP